MTLRWRLFAAIGVIAVLSVALAFAIGAVLTRRAVERNTLRDVSAQADLLAERERKALLACAQLPKEFILRQGERVVCAPLDRASTFVTAATLREVRRRGPSTRRSSFTASAPSMPRAVSRTRRSCSCGRRASPRPPGGRTSRAFDRRAGRRRVAALAAFLLARAISRPVRRVADATRALAAEESPEPVPVEGARELASLARSFNEMAEQLARARAAERQFLLSVSHELKTPLTAIRGYAEGLAEGAVPEDEAAETIAREARR